MKWTTIFDCFLWLCKSDGKLHKTLCRASTRNCFRICCCYIKRDLGEYFMHYRFRFSFYGQCRKNTFAVFDMRQIFFFFCWTCFVTHWTAISLFVYGDKWQRTFIYHFFPSPNPFTLQGSISWNIGYVFIFLIVFSRIWYLPSCFKQLFDITIILNRTVAQPTYALFDYELINHINCCHVCK